MVLVNDERHMLPVAKESTISQSQYCICTSNSFRNDQALHATLVFGKKTIVGVEHDWAAAVHLNLVLYFFDVV
jgi:hypothetical protein